MNKIDTDGEKSTLTVTGEVDPHEIIVRARKVGAAEIISISNPKKPEDKEKEEKEKKEKEEKEKKEKERKEMEQKCEQHCYCRSCYMNHPMLPFNMPDPYAYQEPSICRIL